MKKSNWHGGKGSTPRGTDQNKYSDNWDKIFGSKKKKPVLPVLKEDDTPEIDKS